jgi:hypothetical protein
MLRSLQSGYMVGMPFKYIPELLGTRQRLLAVSSCPAKRRPSRLTAHVVVWNASGRLNGRWALHIAKCQQRQVGHLQGSSPAYNEQAAKNVAMTKFKERTCFVQLLRPMTTSFIVASSCRTLTFLVTLLMWKLSREHKISWVTLRQCFVFDDYYIQSKAY